ncbi:hypothetical protein ACFL23_00345 [Patescibacteria group bacterium]
MKYMGILLPETNTIVEKEIIQMIAEYPNMLNQVSFHFSRIEVKTDYVQSEINFLMELYANRERAYNLLESIPLNIIGFFCTSAIVLGKHKNFVICDMINGIRCVDPLHALILACMRFSSRKVLLLSPYNQQTSQLLESNLKSASVPICQTIVLNINKNIDKYSFEKTKKLIMSNLQDDTDLIIISCTNFRTLDLISFFEKEINIPVISSNQSLFWLMCRELDIECSKLVKYGSIFRTVGRII